MTTKRSSTSLTVQEDGEAIQEAAVGLVRQVQLAARNAVSASPESLPLKDKSQGRAWLGGISPAGIDRLIASGKLPYVKIGARVFFRQEDLDAFVKRCRRNGGR